jgi:hypothetical protein
MEKEMRAVSACNPDVLPECLYLRLGEPDNKYQVSK